MDIDKRFQKIGFQKVREDSHGVTYERIEPTYTNVLSICYKKNGKHLIQSYDKDLFDAKCIGNCNVGLTGYETKLILKKMKKMGLYSKN